jgi:uncharacterized membrane protein
MLTNFETRNIIGWILTIGTIFSALLVLVGGIIYLYQSGMENALPQLAHPPVIYTSFSQIWQAAINGNSLGIIALGVIALVLTQVLRVGLLIVYYLSIRDYKFTLISLFVFLTLIYGFMKQSG